MPRTLAIKQLKERRQKLREQVGLGQKLEEQKEEFRRRGLSIRGQSIATPPAVRREPSPPPPAATAAAPAKTTKETTEKPAAPAALEDILAAQTLLQLKEEEELRRRGQTTAAAAAPAKTTKETTEKPAAPAAAPAKTTKEAATTAPAAAVPVVTTGGGGVGGPGGGAGGGGPGGGAGGGGPGGGGGGGGGAGAVQRDIPQRRKRRSQQQKIDIRKNFPVQGAGGFVRKGTKGGMVQKTGFVARRVGGKNDTLPPCLTENSVSVIATNGANQTFQALVSAVKGRRGVFVCNGPKGPLETPRRVGISTRRIKPDSLFVSTADYAKIVALKAKDNKNPQKRREKFKPMTSTTQPTRPGPRRG